MLRPIASELIDGDATDGAAYVSERKIYPREVAGRFQRLRHLAVWVLLGMYYLFPWLSWDHRQAVLFDLPARKFYVFGLSFWPQDFFFLALLLIMAGLSLFFFTAVAGRLWCGYACPQTVWTEVFLWMERWTEGDRGQRIKLDAAPWSANKARRKLAKHSLWLVFALWTGFTFVGFFTPIHDLAARAPFGWSGWENFWVLFYALATWGNAGVLREQVCKYMCPYARFQSAMFDRNTLIISYEQTRGEPRGSRRKGTPSVLSRESATEDQESATFGSDSPFPVVHSQPLGDCIDCTICVQVCPTGIDIRNGLQYECIACGACVDACDTVMDRMGYPHGLIRYTTQNAIEGKLTRLVRPRVLIYATLLLALLTGTAVGIAERKPIILDVLRDKRLYRVDDDGRIENAYTLRIINKEAKPHLFVLSMQSNAPVTMAPAELRLPAGPEEVLTVPVTLTAAPGAVRGRADVRFVVQDAESTVQQSDVSRFFGPVSP
jgi:cytochrome c oxidase accessory protein FixG